MPEPGALRSVVRHRRPPGGARRWARRGSARSRHGACDCRHSAGARSTGGGDGRSASPGRSGAPEPGSAPRSARCRRGRPSARRSPRTRARRRQRPAGREQAPGRHRVSWLIPRSIPRSALPLLAARARAQVLTLTFTVRVAVRGLVGVRLRRGRLALATWTRPCRSRRAGSCRSFPSVAARPRQRRSTSAPRS